MKGVGLARKKKKKRKLVIRKYAVKPKVPENFADNSWDILERAIDAIYGQTPVPHTREKLYGMVEDLCNHGKAGTLYSRLREKFASQVNSLVRDLSNQTAQIDRCVLEIWRRSMIAGPQPTFSDFAWFSLLFLAVYCSTCTACGHNIAPTCDTLKVYSCSWRPQLSRMDPNINPCGVSVQTFSGIR